MRSGPVGKLVVPLGVPFTAAWPVLARLSVGDVAPLVLIGFAGAVAVALWHAALVVGRVPATRVPLVVGVAVAGLGLGSELGFGFGGGRRLMVVSITLWWASRASGLATMIVLTRNARPRTALFAWRRCQVVSTAISAVVWLLVVTAPEAPTGTVVPLHGVRLDVPGATIVFFLLFAVGLGAEGVLAHRALQATNGWLAGPSLNRPPRPTTGGESVLPYGPPRPPVHGGGA